MSRVWCEVRHGVRVFASYAVKCGICGTNLCITNSARNRKQVEGLPYVVRAIVNHSAWTCVSYTCRDHIHSNSELNKPSTLSTPHDYGIIIIFAISL